MGVVAWGGGLGGWVVGEVARADDFMMIRNLILERNRGRPVPEVIYGRFQLYSASLAYLE